MSDRQRNYRLFEVRPSQVRVLRVLEEYVAQLQMGPGFDPWRRFETEHCL
jgi:hypothetical protein